MRREEYMFECQWDSMGEYSVVPHRRGCFESVAADLREACDGIVDKEEEKISREPVFESRALATPEPVLNTCQKLILVDLSSAGSNHRWLCFALGQASRFLLSSDIRKAETQPLRVTPPLAP